jgi:transcriptional regulator with XRE-family HTH domain
MAIPGSNIRLLRREMGISLQSLAAAAEIDPANLSRLETGKGGYSDASIRRIADVLQVSLEVLFSPSERVEMATLRVREVPVLTPEMLVAWRGPDDADYARSQRYLYVDMARASRYSFGFAMPDAAAAPVLCPGDELIFDAKKQPEKGRFVIASNQSGTVFVGRLRLLPEVDGKPAFDVVPLDNFFATGSSLADRTLELRGTLVELRRSL